MKITVALLAVVAALAGCGGSEPSETSAPAASATSTPVAPRETATKTPEATPEETSSSDDDDYPAVVRKNFLDNCEVDWTERGCLCSLERIEAMMTISEFIEVEDDYKKSGELPESLKDAALACA